MIRQSELQHKIENAACAGIKVKVFFNSNTRNPVAGRFIQAKDYSELKPKNMFRFVIEDRFPYWEKSHTLTISKIFSLEAIFDVKVYEN